MIDHDTYILSGEHFVQVLSAIKNTATGLMVEARSLSEQINYLAMQQQRLGVVVHELAGREGGGGGGRPMSRPFEGYTTEVTQALQAFAMKIQRLKETQQSLTVELDSSQRDVHHLHQKCNDATMSQQDVNKELALVRQEKASTDIQYQDLVQRYKLLMEDLGMPMLFDILSLHRITFKTFFISRVPPLSYPSYFPQLSISIYLHPLRLS